jgi:hypothetical protein
MYDSIQQFNQRPGMETLLRDAIRPIRTIEKPRHTATHTKTRSAPDRER